MILSDRLSWMKDAACRGEDIDPSLFFPERGQSNREALAVCAVCPVKAECLEYGAHEHHGIFGGQSERQRRIARSGARVFDRVCAQCGGEFVWSGLGAHPRACSRACRARLHLAAQAERRLRRSA